MSQKPPAGGLKANTFAKLSAAREDTTPDIEGMADKARAVPVEEPPKRKNLVLRIDPALQKGLKVMSLDRDQTVENMVIELLEGLVADHKATR